MSRVPVPFAFQPSMELTTVAPGKDLWVDLTLVGWANDRLVYIVHALREAGARGLGPGRGRISLERVDLLSTLDGDETSPVIFDGAQLSSILPVTPRFVLTSTGNIHVGLWTPLRLKRNGRLITPEAFTAADIAEAAFRRISALAACHTGSPINANYRALKTAATQLSFVERNFRWADWTRRSSRQSQTMTLGGIVGTATLHVPEPAALLLPWLDIGQWVGIGKGTSMGLGQVRFDGAGTRPHE